MRLPRGILMRSREPLILFAAKKMSVDHPRVNTIFPISSCHGPNPNPLSDELSTTLREFTIRIISLSCDQLSCAPYIRRNGVVVPLVPFPTDFATCTCNYNKPTNIRCKWSKIKNSIVRCVKSTWYNKLNDGGLDDEYFDEMYQYEV